MMSYLRQTSSEKTVVTFENSGATNDSRVKGIWTLALSGSRILCTRRRAAYHVNIASNGSTARKWLLTSLMRFRGHSYVLHLHGGGFDNFYRSLNPFFAYAVRSMFQRADGTAVLGKVWQNFVEEELRVSAKKIHLLPNAVPGPAEVPLRAGPVRVLFSGRVGVRKGALELLRAWKNIKHDGTAQLILAGDVEKVDSLLEALKSSENTRVTGWIDSVLMCEELGRASIIVLPSHGENLPLSLLEGAAWGLAPISTRVGAIPEVITSGQNGLIVEPGDSRGLAEALQTLIDEPSIRHRFGSEFRKTWELGFNVLRYREAFDAMHLEVARRIR
ncbi:glycosyltransferase family 4 protein [Kocuria rosea]|uniref:glycosyltransferase family 4 protein n=1 Tax=Kocuria rosea TaxID=1275 RepID=UPI001304AD0B|nr:glycosyltransferase family 4 protein [Kocuria rosea]